MLSWHLSLLLLLPIQVMDTLQMVLLYPLLFHADLSVLTLRSSLCPVTCLWSCSHDVSSNDFLLIFSLSPLLALIFLIHIAVALLWFLSPFLVLLSAGLFCIHRREPKPLSDAEVILAPMQK